MSQYGGDGSAGQLLVKAPCDILKNLIIVASRLKARVAKPIETNTSRRKQQTSLYEYPLHLVPLLGKEKRTTERCPSVIHSSSTVAIFTTETSL
jgi:hypothetical protein